jgi:hypothetical protein
MVALVTLALRLSWLPWLHGCLGSFAYQTLPSVLFKPKWHGGLARISRFKELVTVRERSLLLNDILRFLK